MEKNMEYTLGRVGIVVYPAYDNTKTYQPLDLVPYNGGSYIAKSETQGHLPTDAQYWTCIATANIELRSNDTHIQWKSGLGTWADLIPLSELKGPQGDNAPVSNFVDNIRTGSQTLSVNPSTGGTSTITKHITFDTERETIPQWVSLTTTSNFTSLKYWNFSTGNYSTTGFDVYMCRASTTSSTSGTVGIRYCAI